MQGLKDPSSIAEDYLKALLHEEAGGPGRPVAPGRLAARLAVAPGTVTAMLKNLAAAGLVRYEPYVGARLTARGRRLAAGVLRRHRLLELFLVEVLGMDWSEVHEEAERLEHAVSGRVLERLAEFLGHPEADPHGDPIPGPGGELPALPLVPLTAAPLRQPCRVARILDQTPPFLELVEARGLRPGAQVEVLSRDPAADVVRVRSGRRRPFELGSRAAARILVHSQA